MEKRIWKTVNDSYYLLTTQDDGEEIVYDENGNVYPQGIMDFMYPLEVGAEKNINKSIISTWKYKLNIKFE